MEVQDKRGASRDPARGFSFQAALGDFPHQHLPVPAVPSMAQAQVLCIHSPSL